MMSNMPQLSLGLSISELCEQFSAAIARAIGVSHMQVVPDGRLRRFDDPEGRPHNRAAWYVLHCCPSFGAVGSWRSGKMFKWRPQGAGPISVEVQLATERAIKQAALERQRQQLSSHEYARGEALRLWRAAMPASCTHAYLKTKAISAQHLRQRMGELLVPLIDVNGELHNLQRVYPNGEKRFLKGGRVKGLFSLVGAKQLSECRKIYVAEGVATAVSVYEATQTPVVAAMNAGNLLPVVQSIREAHPVLAIVIAADNDHRTPQNPGLEYARKVASKYGLPLQYPAVPCGPNCLCTDFNDVAHCWRYHS